MLNIVSAHFDNDGNVVYSVEGHDKMRRVRKERFIIIRTTPYMCRVVLRSYISYNVEATECGEDFERIASSIARLMEYRKRS